MEKGDFAHRTSVFEGAYRAWSYLGGLDHHDINSSSIVKFDRIAHSLENDKHLQEEGTNSDSAPERRMYKYKPLPQLEFSHPFVRSVLQVWLNNDQESTTDSSPSTDADNNIKKSFSVLSTWWRHRKKGQSPEL
eukprot:2718401-Ditylum_brightwellii.AAC.1